MAGRPFGRVAPEDPFSGMLAGSDLDDCGLPPVTDWLPASTHGEMQLVSIVINNALYRSV